MKTALLLCVGLSVAFEASPAFAWGTGPAMPPPSTPAPSVEPPSGTTPPAPEAPPPDASDPATATPLPDVAPPTPAEAIVLEEEPEQPVTKKKKHRRKRHRHHRAIPSEPSAAPMPPPESPSPERLPRREWYGWQTLVIDGVSLGMVASGNEAATGWGVAGYLFGTPIAHLAHRNVGYGFASFGLRFGMPLAGAMLGGFVSGCIGDHSTLKCSTEVPATGFALGVAGAIAIDAAVFAYTKPKRRAPESAGLRVTPTFSVDRGAARAGLAGAF